MRWAAVVLAAFAVSSIALGRPIELPRTVPSYNQAYTDGPGAWGECRLGTGGCPDRVATTGCLTTAFASVLGYYGVELSVPASASCSGRARSGMDPGILNDWLRAHAGYGKCVQDPLGACCLAWGQLPGGVELSFHVNRSEVGLNPVASVIIDHALRQGHPVVAGVHWGPACRSGGTQTEDCHWVVLTGKDDDTYSILDPFNPDRSSRYGVRTTLDAGVHGAYIIDRFVIVERTAGSATPPTQISSVPESDGDTGDGGASVLVLVAALAVIAAIVVGITAIQR